MIRTVFKCDVQDPAKMAHSKMALFQRPCYVRTVNLRAQHEGCQWHYAIILLRRDSAGESGGRAARSSGQSYYGLAGGVLLSVWRRGLLSPLHQLFRCALPDRRRTRCSGAWNLLSAVAVRWRETVFSASCITATR
jgi:hypothetical protein